VGLVAVGPIVIWRFPKMEEPPNHPFIDEFSIVNHPAIGSPIYASQARWPTSQMKEKQVKARCPETGDAFVDETWRY
jgi:hypothetical protein